MDIDDTLDVRNLNCPIPLLQTKKKLATMQGGQLLLVIATDPDSLADFNIFTQQTGHRLLKQEKNPQGKYEFIIEKRLP